jgi:hypothetical protein
MEDVTLTRLFERMDAHLTQQDAHLAEITATLREQNAVLIDMSRLLTTTAQQVSEMHAEASRGFAGAMHVLSNLANWLDARLSHLEGDR